jgi:glycosyltransferase involved in cell wall biosynthesis
VHGIVAGWGVPAGRLQVIANGVPPPEVPLPAREAVRRELGFEGFVVTSIGRFIPLKRFDRLITAVGRLRDRVPEVRLLLIGSGPSEPVLRAHAEAAGMADRVRFAGRLPHAEVMRHLRGSDLFALVSTHEGFSHVLLEAMQAGVPAIATDVGGNRETLEDGRCGRLLASAEPDAIAAGILELARAPEERARLAAAGEARAAASWPAMVARTIETLSRVRSERPR